MSALCVKYFSAAWYGPSDLIVRYTTARDRRAFGFWTLVGAAVGTALFGTQVLWVAILSVVALIPNVTAETPVEQEDV